VERLPRGVTLEQLQAVNDWMLGAGLDIEVCNAVRKRVSLLKGGRLALQLAPRPVLCLMLSDVPDNNPATIGSGPLVPDARLGEAPPFVDRAPAFVRDLLEQAPPAPAPGDPAFARVQIAIVATLDDAKHAAHEAAHTLGYRAIVEPQFVDGDALRVGARLAQVVVDAEPGSLHVWGGETQVMLPPHPGRGGRSQSLALAAAQVLRDHPNVLFLAAGTDGSDGPTEDAGALVDGGTLARGTARGLDPGTALARADAGSFLQASGDLIRTGPTGTNVMDMMLGLKF
jgi:hydroxypyruvate reductase